MSLESMWRTFNVVPFRMASISAFLVSGTAGAGGASVGATWFDWIDGGWLIGNGGGTGAMLGIGGGGGGGAGAALGGTGAVFFCFIGNDLYINEKFRIFTCASVKCNNSLFKSRKMLWYAYCDCDNTWNIHTTGLLKSIGGGRLGGGPRCCCSLGFCSITGLGDATIALGAGGGGGACLCVPFCNIQLKSIKTTQMLTSIKQNLLVALELAAVALPFPILPNPVHYYVEWNHR